MAAPLTAARQVAVQAACNTARANALCVTMNTTSLQWHAILQALAATLIAVNGDDRGRIQPEILSFSSNTHKNNYYRSLPGAPGARLFREDPVNITRGITGPRLESGDVVWNCILSGTAIGSFAAGTTGHNVFIEMIEERQTTALTNGAVKLAIRPTQPVNAAAADCVSLALVSLVDLVQNILIHNHTDPRHAGNLANLQRINVTR
ncbi:hypothetical protein LTR49_025820 [Elasticomyces elasticus]|nr:hypothetical protein LTR49_025820 [Elasticomyces elasticus]